MVTCKLFSLQVDWKRMKKNGIDGWVPCRFSYFINIFPYDQAKYIWDIRHSMLCISGLLLNTSGGVIRHKAKGQVTLATREVQ